MPEQPFFDTRRTRVEIDLDAIEHNLGCFRRILPENTKTMAVVKADGYGHGAVPVLKRAVQAGASWAGVALVEEAEQLRRADFDLPILLLGGWFEHSLPHFKRLDLTPIVYSEASLELLAGHVRKNGEQMAFHLKLDTGMGRLGIDPRILEKVLDRIESEKGLLLDGILSHLSSADEEQTDFTKQQIATFYDAVEKIQERFDPTWVHLANSAGASEFEIEKGNLCRIGISLYGQPAAPRLQNRLDLKEALCWKTKIVQLKWFDEGVPISYNRTFITPRRSLVGVLPVGYGDGYSRHLSNKAMVLVRGQKAPVIGRVCMDMIMIDLTDLHEVKLYDEAVLIGKQGDQKITATQMAELAGTINYEITCNISKRVQRTYKSEK